MCTVSNYYVMWRRHDWPICSTYLKFWAVTKILHLEIDFTAYWITLPTRKGNVVIKRLGKVVDHCLLPLPHCTRSTCTVPIVEKPATAAPVPPYPASMIAQHGRNGGGGWWLLTSLSVFHSFLCVPHMSYDEYTCTFVHFILYRPTSHGGSVQQHVLLPRQPRLG